MSTTDDVRESLLAASETPDETAARHATERPREVVLDRSLADQLAALVDRIDAEPEGHVILAPDAEADGYAWPDVTSTAAGRSVTERVEAATDCGCPPNGCEEAGAPGCYYGTAVSWLADREKAARSPQEARDTVLALFPDDQRTGALSAALDRFEAALTPAPAPRGWTAEEARQHTVPERLRERCATYAGATCPDRDLPRAEWCERCLAAYLLDADPSALAADLRALEAAATAARETAEPEPPTVDYALALMRSTLLTTEHPDETATGERGLFTHAEATAATDALRPQVTRMLADADDRVRHARVTTEAACYAGAADDPGPIDQVATPAQWLRRLFDLPPAARLAVASYVAEAAALGSRCHGENHTAEVAGLRASLLAAERRVEELEAAEDESDDVRARLADLLRRTANAFKGEPPALTSHDWSDLPDLAARAVAQVAGVRVEPGSAVYLTAEGPVPMKCATASPTVTWCLDCQAVASEVCENGHRLTVRDRDAEPAPTLAQALDADGGETCEREAADGYDHRLDADYERLLAEAREAGCSVPPYDDEPEPTAAPLCPECAAGKDKNCTGDMLNDRDEWVRCATALAKEAQA